MKTSTIVFLLIAAVCARTVQGKESPDGKPTIYNIITKRDTPADDAATRKAYGAKYHIVDVPETKAFVPPKDIKRPPLGPARDAAGKLLNIKGTVRVIFIVNIEGRVLDPFVSHSSDPRLNSTALTSIKQWQSSPARLNGLPIAIGATQDFIFEAMSEKRIQIVSQDLAIDAKGARHSRSDNGKDSWMEDITKQVEPDYPADDRGEGDGDGLFRLTLDLKTGAVTNATVVVSTGSKGLDQHALSALRQWVWKPGKWRQVTVHVFFAHQSKTRIPFSGNSSFPPYGSQPSYFPPGIPR